MAVRKTGQAAPAGGTKSASWDGRFVPPSWEAAYEWAEKHGFSRKWLDIHLGPVVNGNPDDKTRPAADDVEALVRLGDLIRKNRYNPVRDWVGDPKVPASKESYDFRGSMAPTVGPNGDLSPKIPAPNDFREWQKRADRGEFRTEDGTPTPKTKKPWTKEPVSFITKAVRKANTESNAEELEYWHDKIRMLRGLEKAIATSRTNKERGSDSEATQRDLAAIVAEREEAEGKVNTLNPRAYAKVKSESGTTTAAEREKGKAALAAGEETSDSGIGDPPPTRLGAGAADDAILWPAGMEKGSTSDETKVDNQRRGYLSKTWMDGQVEAWRKENPGAELPDNLAFYEDKKRFDPEDTRIKARYRTKDLGMWERWDSAMIASVQKDFEAIGLYKATGGKYNLGDWRGKESSFFAMLLAEANMEGLEWQEMLAEWKKNPPQVILDDLGAGSGGGRTPNPIQITNPDDIRSEARTASKSLTGQMRPGFDESMVGGFQGSEIAAGQALNTEGVAGTGGVVTDPATPGAYAEAQLRANSGPEVGAYSTLGAFNAILQELGLAG